MSLILDFRCIKADKGLKDWDLIWSDEFDSNEIDLLNWEFDIGTGAPFFEEFGISSPYFIPENFPQDNFSVRWEGQIKVNHTCEYTFYTISDDGVRLFINDKKIIDNWTTHPATENKGTISLKKGEECSIRIEYFEESGGEAMILGWESENFTKKLISSANLTTKDGMPGLKGTYYRNKNLKPTKIKKPVVRIDKELNWVT